MNETKIPRAACPEAVQVSSVAVNELIGDILEHELELHSLMVVRHGKVAFETFRKPYVPEMPHVMFSVSKSVTSCAIGFAVAEGLLSVDDKVADLVPELRGGAEDENLERLTVRHLLTMTSGKLISVFADKTKKQWIQDFAEAKWTYGPGEGWSYINENIYMLCVILSRVTGMGVVDYLMPRLFGPLGIPRPFWETDGHGVEAGGWGLYLTTESFAKIMLCYTQGGVFEGKQVIPAGWVAESTKLQAKQNDGSAEPHGNNGYGYCFWLNAEPGGFRADGVFSQLGLCFPAYDACVITTAGEIFSHKMLDALFRHIPQLFEEAGDREQEAGAVITALPEYPALEESPRNYALEAQLEARRIHFPSSLQQVPKMLGFPVSVMPMAVFFMSADRAGGIDQVRLRFQENTCKFSWSEGAERNTVLCGLDGRARKCLITLGGVQFPVACSAAWDGDNKFRIRIRPMNSVAERRLTFQFFGRQVRMVPRSSPSLSTIGEYAAPFVQTMVPNHTIAGIMSNTMDKIALVAEPVHIGYLR
ncbi:MAG: beta-lactamase family protein [Oscillospiraceae bacterium]|jgi:CubicO group peptidase (beta-lactamase class C family)|nr:beta-lactamase family protein [Oscillospiraceae bacterium]